MTTPLCVPLDRYGIRILDRVPNRFPLDYGKKVGHWVSATPFYAVLQFMGIEQKKGRWTAWWRNVLVEQGLRHYPMSMRQLDRTLRAVHWQVPGIVDGRWGYDRRGRYFSIVPLLEDD